MKHSSLLLLIITACGYQPPKDQCIGKGTECHAENSSTESQDRSDNSGLPGPIGPSGPRGPAGEQGPQGIPGSGCTVTQGTGGATITCPDGSTAVIRDGSPGSVLLPIRFCPNTEPNYPNVFPEVGFCIDNRLYAVYSMNGGYMAEIPPGLYTSNAIGSSCTFRVTLNCQIEH